MNRILLIIVALIVAFGAFTFLGNKDTNQTPTKSSESVSSEKTTKTAVTQPSSQIVTVILTDSEFSPKDITIKVGIRVVWVNKSGKAATVNSDDHPTHRLYSFLNLGEFPNSSSLQVVFDKSGKYGYHNHNNTSETGTVTVE